MKSIIVFIKNMNGKMIIDIGGRMILVNYI